MSCLLEINYKKVIENEFKKFKRRDSDCEFCELFYPQNFKKFSQYALFGHYFFTFSMASFLNSEKLYLDYKNSTTLNKFLKKIPPSEENILLDYLRYKWLRNKFREFNY